MVEGRGRLQRDVAVKVLPKGFSSDPARASCSKRESRSRVTRPVDLSHGASADGGLDFVGAETGAGSERQW